LTEPEENATPKPIDTSSTGASSGSGSKSGSGSTPPAGKTSRARRYLFLALCVLFIAIAAPLAVGFLLSSNAAQEFARARMVERLEQATGGRVQIAAFHWHLLQLQAEADGVVIRGNEEPGQAPFAQVERLRAGLSLLGFWSPHLTLRELAITGPAMHLIIYPDGTTNAPQPRKPRKAGKPAMDTLFDLQAGHVSMERGVFDLENRAAEFDFQNRFALMDFDAQNLELLMRYVPASGRNMESYHIEAAAKDLSLTRVNEKPAVGSLQAVVDLTRAQAVLRSLTITSKLQRGREREQDHTLRLTGELTNFAHPVWQARTTGELDMRMLEPAFGYPFAPEGVAQLNLDTTGEGGEFRTDGTVHLTHASYLAPGITARDLLVDTHVHADPRQLLITKIVAHPHGGGEADGDISISPWLPGPQLKATAPARAADKGPHPPHWAPAPYIDPNAIITPVNGKVSARFKDLPLDTVLQIVSPAPFDRLGLASLLTGTAEANWVKGDQNTLVVTTQVGMSPPTENVPGETPASGAVDATYTQRDGGVEVRKAALQTPASQIDVTGHLGAYPLTSPSGLNVDLRSHNLGEFDTILRDLGLHRYGKAGAAALPLTLAGEGEFHGSWTGSLIDPHFAGTATATNVGLEMVPPAGAGAQSEVQPGFAHWDAAEATGSYAAERVVIQHGTLKRGPAQIAMEGTLDATPPVKPGSDPEFDASSRLHLKLSANKVAVGELEPVLGEKLPVTGTLDAQLEANGPLRALDAAGWLELNNGVAYAEPVTHMHADATLKGRLLTVVSGTAVLPAGTLTANGTYDLKSDQFKIDARGAGLDVAKVQAVRRQNASVSGTLGFSLSGSGTVSDPRLEAHATLGALTVGGESLGALVFAGHTANHEANYNATTRLEGAKVDLNGQTALTADYQTQAKVEFANFDIGGLLNAAHVQGLSGKSSMAGTISVEGPLEHPVAMHGDARLKQIDATIAGVHLQDQGGVHAVLTNGTISLDPLHITGEDTDLRAQGSLSLKDQQRLDLAASGSINLKLAETVDPDLTAGGTTTFQVEAHGTVKDPGLRGRVDFNDGSLSIGDVSNGLSQLRGTLEFNQNRLEVKSLTAMSGGGLLSVGGYLSYQHGLFANLSVAGKGIRIRYPEGVSSLADTNLYLQGPQKNLLLSGDVLITRFSVSQDLDIAALASQANTVPTIAAPDAPSNHFRLDIHIASSPQLNFQNSYAKLAGNVDLNLRGTVASPSLLGRVSITEGSAIIAGTRYDLQRGDIFFANPVRVEPSIDLNATARVEDYDITLGLHGTPQKMAVTYRSDPPLPEADVVALLALGRTENQQRLYTQQQEQYVSNPTTDALLGGALNATVSSRVQKLFGAGSVKVDPNYIGTLGNSTSRITVEEQVGRNLTLTYATDVDTTGQQLLQAEIAINRHVSLLVARDESGVFSMVVKATRRYR
jgi:translocation and assembly module TamB